MATLDINWRVKPRITKQRLRFVGEHILNSLRINKKMTAFEIVQGFPDTTDTNLIQRTAQVLLEIGRIDIDSQERYHIRRHPMPYPRWWFVATGKPINSYDRENPSTPRREKK